MPQIGGMSKVNRGDSDWVLAFSEVCLDDKAYVGGKNSSLGHLYNVLRPDFAARLVRHGISSISVNPDAFVQTLAAVHAAEQGRLVPGSKNGNTTYAEVSSK